MTPEKYTESIIYSYDDVPINELLEIVQKNKDRGATTVNIEVLTDNSDVAVRFNFYYKED